RKRAARHAAPEDDPREDRGLDPHRTIDPVDGKGRKRVPAPEPGVAHPLCAANQRGRAVVLGEEPMERRLDRPAALLRLVAHRYLSGPRANGRGGPLPRRPQPWGGTGRTGGTS